VTIGANAEREKKAGAREGKRNTKLPPKTEMGFFDDLGAWFVAKTSVAGLAIPNYAYIIVVFCLFVLLVVLVVAPSGASVHVHTKSTRAPALSN
jgi:hypothetical protein